MTPQNIKVCPLGKGIWGAQCGAGADTVKFKWQELTPNWSKARVFTVS